MRKYARWFFLRHSGKTDDYSVLSLLVCSNGGVSSGNTEEHQSREEPFQARHGDVRRGNRDE